jgi:hypothetical protein
VVDTDLVPEVPQYSRQILKISDFMHEWSKGLPLVITDVLMQGRWDPQYFIDNYGNKVVTLVNCETGETRQSKVGKFFNLFLHPEERIGIWAGIWKLKVMCFVPVLWGFSQLT